MHSQGGLAGNGAGADVNKHSSPGPTDIFFPPDWEAEGTDKPGGFVPGSGVWYIKHVSLYFLDFK